MPVANRNGMWNRTLVLQRPHYFLVLQRPHYFLVLPLALLLTPGLTARLAVALAVGLAATTGLSSGGSAGTGCGGGSMGGHSGFYMERRDSCRAEVSGKEGGPTGGTLVFAGSAPGGKSRGIE